MRYIGFGTNSGITKHKKMVDYLRGGFGFLGLLRVQNPDSDFEFFDDSFWCGYGFDFFFPILILSNRRKNLAFSFVDYESEINVLLIGQWLK